MGDECALGQVLTSSCNKLGGVNHLWSHSPTQTILCRLWVFNLVTFYFNCIPLSSCVATVCRPVPCLPYDLKDIGTRKDWLVFTMTSAVLIPGHQILQELMTITFICRVAMYVRCTYLSLKQPNGRFVTPIVQEKKWGLLIYGCTISPWAGWVSSHCSLWKLPQMTK